MKPFDEAYIAELRKWEPGAAAQVYDERIRHLEARDKQTFAERGLIMLEMEQRELWRHVGGGQFGSLDAWIHNAAPESNSSCYAALRVARTLGNVIPVQEQNEIPRCNLEVLSKVSTAVARRPEIREAAKGKNAEFVAKIQREFPLEHIEHDRPMRFKPDESQRAAIDEALMLAAVLEEAANREEALTCLAVSYVLDHREEYEREMKKRGKSSDIGAFSTVAGSIQ